MADVYISLEELRDVSTQLGTIVTEFENADSRSDALETAIGTPYNDSRLRSEASEFEERWDDKRQDLKEALEAIQEHVDAVIDGVDEWDSETAIALEPEE